MDSFFDKKVLEFDGLNLIVALEKMIKYKNNI